MKKDSLKMSWDNHCMGHNKELDIQDVCDQRAEHVLYWYSQLIGSTAQNIILFQPRLWCFCHSRLGQLTRIMTRILAINEVAWGELICAVISFDKTLSEFLFRSNIMSGDNCDMSKMLNILTWWHVMVGIV